MSFHGLLGEERGSHDQQRNEAQRGKGCIGTGGRSGVRTFTCQHSPPCDLDLSGVTSFEEGTV